jgi:hypothetical protein
MAPCQKALFENALRVLAPGRHKQELCEHKGLDTAQSFVYTQGNRLPLPDHTDCIILVGMVKVFSALMKD